MKASSNNLPIDSDASFPPMWIAAKALCGADTTAPLEENMILHAATQQLREAYTIVVSASGD